MTKRLVLISSTLMIAAAFIFIGLAFSSSQASAASITKLSNINSGDLIRGESYSAVYYYGKDGFRYVFPNSKTYFTWYDNFNGVKWLTDSDLAKVQIGGNVTYRPGVKMIKINSDSRTYAVSKGGTLRHVKTEAVAKGLYGNAWNKQVDDVPDGFFSNYNIGGALDIAGSFSVSGEKGDSFSINVDKGLQSATVVNVSDSGYNSNSTTISKGTAVKFVNNGPGKHSASGDNGKWGTGTMVKDGMFSKYFKDAGIYKYHDAYNDNLTGVLIVE
jgi:plastocyanin